jgi:hypothetical protein
MNSFMRGLQRNNPLHGFSVAVEDPDTGMCVGFLKSFQLENQKIIWQTHNLEEFTMLTGAANYLVNEARTRRLPNKPLLSIKELLRLYPIACNQDSDYFSEQDCRDDKNLIQLCFKVIEFHGQIVSCPSLDYSSWTPLRKGKSYPRLQRLKIQDLSNSWLKPLYVDSNNPKLTFLEMSNQYQTVINWLKSMNFLTFKLDLLLNYSTHERNFPNYSRNI